MIPKPPKQIKIHPDKRMERLLEWKRLFEAISPDIKVFVRDKNIKWDGVFNKECERILESCGHRYLEGINSIDFEIAVDTSKGYLMGHSHNHMFSDVDVSDDAAFAEENDVSYEPKTKPWKYWYEEVCKQYDSLHQSIPTPPTEKPGADT